MDRTYRLSGVLEIPARPVVIVEDDAKDEKLMLRVFHAINLSNPIIVLRDGEEALEYFQCRGRYADRDPQLPPVVVLLDLKLPKLDGLEVLAEMRKDERTQALPVIILTSSDEPADKLRSYALGAYSYVRKPTDYAEFKAAVAQIGIYWTTRNEPPE